MFFPPFFRCFTFFQLQYENEYFTAYQGTRYTFLVFLFVSTKNSRFIFFLFVFFFFVFRFLLGQLLCSRIGGSKRAISDRRPNRAFLRSLKKCLLDPNFSIEQSNPRIPSKKSTVSTECTDALPENLHVRARLFEFARKNRTKNAQLLRWKPQVFPTAARSKPSTQRSTR